jgi:hypothetical protein
MRFSVLPTREVAVEERGEWHLFGIAVRSLHQRVWDSSGLSLQAGEIPVRFQAVCGEPGLGTGPSLEPRGRESMCRAKPSHVMKDTRRMRGRESMRVSAFGSKLYVTNRQKTETKVS